VSVKFLSQEWADEVTVLLNGDQEFKTAAAGKRATVAQVITGGEADTSYWISIDDGAISMGLGDAEAADATITQSYETAVKLATSELNPVTAFMIGKVKIGGNMGLLMGLQGALVRLPVAMQAIDVEY
jgi:putative sterol carrier protein